MHSMDENQEIMAIDRILNYSQPKPKEQKGLQIKDDSQEVGDDLLNRE